MTKPDERCFAVYDGEKDLLVYVRPDVFHSMIKGADEVPQGRVAATIGIVPMGGWVPKQSDAAAKHDK